MKVIEKGRPQKGWAIEAVCSGQGNGGGGCGAKLLVEQPDVYQTESNARDETTYYHTFCCPECKVETDLETVPNRANIPMKADWIERQKALNIFRSAQAQSEDSYFKDLLNIMGAKSVDPELERRFRHLITTIMNRHS